MLNQALDITVSDQGTVVLFTIHSMKARSFVARHVGVESYQWADHRTFAVDHRYAPALIEAMADHNLIQEVA